ncbi:MAG: hypothetical protein DMG83_12135 [Acidobacteria bacterium]|nr:MAG: hypothetical protein DMG83_12135 [Acidobacteriota bacterium]
MKLLSIGAFVLFVACAASLFSGGQATVLLHHTWRRAADVLPEREINELAVVIPACRARVFELFPPTLREKVAAKTWTAVELITLRLLLALYLAPTFIIASGIGFLEGSWARSNQQSLVKIHSPMRFSLALTGVGLCPAVILLWATVPLMVPVIILILFVSTLAVFSVRNLVVHSPTQF